MQRTPLSHSQVLASDRGGKNTELVVNNPSFQHPAPLTVGTSSNHVTEIPNQGQTPTRCSESQMQNPGLPRDQHYLCAITFYCVDSRKILLS